jgi:hypothetical protein
MNTPIIDLPLTARDKDILLFLEWLDKAYYKTEYGYTRVGARITGKTDLVFYTPAECLEAYRREVTHPADLLFSQLAERRGEVAAAVNAHTQLQETLRMNDALLGGFEKIQQVAATFGRREHTAINDIVVETMAQVAS